MRKVLLCLVVGGLWSFAFPLLAAELPDAFQVEVRPSSFAVNQSVDVTIKAIKNNEVMKNYVGEPFMEVKGKSEGRDLSYNDYVLPNDGFAEFTLANQGIVTYSKGLKLNKPGNFTVFVSSLQQDSISGATTIIVTSDTQANLKPIMILSPSPGLDEKTSMLDIIANAPELPNARMQILLNDQLSKEGTSDAQGLLTESIPGLIVGTNYVQIKALSLAGEVVGMSEKVIFTYTPQTDNLYKNINVTPNQGVKLGDKVRIEVFTDENVSSAKLFLSGSEYPLDREKAGLFSKEIMILQTGDVAFGVDLSAGVELNKRYENILELNVRDNIKIGEVKIVADPELAGALQLTRTIEGESTEHYAIKYGLSQDDLQGLVTTTGQSAILSGFTYGKEYFFQVFATTEDQVPEGLPSEVIAFTMPIGSGKAPELVALSGGVLVEPQEEHAAPKLPTCVVKNIGVTTQKIGNAYYLTWRAVENATSYRVYTSDFADNSNKAFLGETQLPRFEYPFDKTIEDERYAYYTVEAICADGERLVLTDAKKVQVGPLEDMMLILASTALVYLMYRLYNYNV